MLDDHDTHHSRDRPQFCSTKHPARLQTFGLNFVSSTSSIRGHRSSSVRPLCLLDVDAVAWSGGEGSIGGRPAPLAQYVNDPAYVASSLLASNRRRHSAAPMAGRKRRAPRDGRPAIALSQRFPCHSLPSARGT